MSAGIVAEIWAVAASGKSGHGDEKEKCEARKRGKKGKRGASGVGFATCKEQAEWAELCFMARARQIGLAVLKPYGDSSQYDVGIEHKGWLARVQVKSTTSYGSGRSPATWRGRGEDRASGECWIF